MTIKKNFHFQVLFNSLKLVWHNKILWFFGLFTIFLGTGQWHKIISNDFFGLLRKNTFLYEMVQIKINFHNLMERIYSDPFSAFMIFILFLLVGGLFLLMLWISIVSQGGLIYSIFRSLNGKKIDVYSGISMGRRNFWALFSLNVIEKFIIWSFSILLGLFSFFVIRTGNTYLIFLLTFTALLLILIAAIVSLVIKYAFSYVILKGYTPFKSIFKAIRLFFQRFLLNMEIAVFVFFINYIFKYLVIVLITVLLIPLSSIGGFTLMLTSGISFKYYFILIPSLIVFVLLWLFSMLTAYNYSVWVTVFIALVDEQRKNISLIKKVKEKIIGEK